MNNKLLLTDITDLLAPNAKISKKEASAFLKLLFDLIEEQLLVDKIVKIKGFGTFKLIWVESRRIANVNTGELQEISGHYKTTFTPDVTLAEAVNEPFAHLETIDLDEDSVVDQPIDKKAEEPSHQYQTIASEPVQKKIESVEISTEKQTIEEPAIEQQEEQKKEEPSPRERNSTTPILLAIFLLIASISYNGYEFWKAFHIMPSSKIAVKSVQAAATDSVQLKSDSSTVATTIVENKDSIITTEMMEAGSRLTRIAQKYYGNKVFWVYLYQANKYVIDNPNRVTAGTVIEIPNAKIYGIDASNPQSVANAKALESEIQRQFE